MLCIAFQFNLDREVGLQNLLAATKQRVNVFDQQGDAQHVFNTLPPPFAP